MRLVDLPAVLPSPFTFTRTPEAPTMALLVPRSGGLALLAELLSSGEDFELALFTSEKSPAEADDAAAYGAIEASGAWYGRKPLSREVGAGKWSTPSLAAPTGGWSARGQVAGSAYAPQSWTVSGPAVEVHGYFVVGATSGELILAERFAVARTLQPGDSLTVTPRLELA